MELDLPLSHINHVSLPCTVTIANTKLKGILNQFHKLSFHRKQISVLKSEVDLELLFTLQYLVLSACDGAILVYVEMKQDI